MSVRPLVRASVVLTSVLALLAINPRPSGAIRLAWKSGETDLSFTEARSCTLFVQAEPGSVLPVEWRLVWVAANDSGPSSPIAFVAEEGASGDPAAVCEVVGPSNPVDAASRAVVARYCSANAASDSVARLILDAPSGVRGRLQVVAFEASPTDSMAGTTIRSGEITLNGGCGGSYPPVVFRAASTHRLGQLDVRLVGTNLDQVTQVPISARDSSWTYPLTLTTKSSECVSAHGVLAAPLPDFVVAAQGGGGGVGAASVPADDFPPLSPQACFATFEGSLDTTGMQPKDFAFVYAGDSWHVFYTRQYQTGYADRTNARRIGHARSTDQHLSSWTVLSRDSIHVREGRIWDNLHVWAPTIVRKPGDITFYMFYTGVQLDTLSQSPTLVTSEIQRIGIATSLDLDSWKQDSTPVYFNKKTSWAFHDSTQDVAWAFRDPFVMPDPEHTGEWLLYFVAVDSCARISGSNQCSSQFVVGVARTQNKNLRNWADVGPLVRTAQSHMAADRDESPHALFRKGNWWLIYTSNHFWGDQITYALNGTSPASLDTTTWTAPDSLKAITCGQHAFPSSLNQWHATEYVGIGPNEYLSAFSDDLFNGGVIQFTQVVAPDGSCPSDSIRLDCPDAWTAVEPGAGGGLSRPIEFVNAGAIPAHGVARLRLSISRPGRIHVAVYDLLGRRVRTLMDGWMTDGATTLLWDGRFEGSGVAGSGIYFARATGAAGRAVVRIPLVR